jgi:hypothetical protein
LTHVAAISTGYQYDTYAVIYAPVIVGDFSPVITVLDGVALTVNARGRPPMTYQWRLNGRNIPDETGFQLVIGRPHSNAEAARLKYDVVVSNAFGTTTSASIIAPFVEANAGAVTGAPSAPPVITPILPLPPTPTNGGNAGLIIEMMPLRPTLTVVPPGTLKMMRSEHNVLLMWANTPGAVLESTDDLTRGFSQDNSDASVAGGLKILRVTPNAAQRFYRVRQN